MPYIFCKTTERVVSARRYVRAPGKIPRHVLPCPCMHVFAIMHVLPCIMDGHVLPCMHYYCPTGTTPIRDTGCTLYCTRVPVRKVYRPRPPNEADGARLEATHATVDCQRERSRTPAPFIVVNTRSAEGNWGRELCLYHCRIQ